MEENHRGWCYVHKTGVMGRGALVHWCSLPVLLTMNIGINVKFLVLHVTRYEHLDKPLIVNDKFPTCREQTRVA